MNNKSRVRAMKAAFHAVVTAVLVLGSLSVHARNSCPTDRDHAIYSSVVVNVGGVGKWVIVSPDKQKQLHVRIRVDEKAPDGWDTQLLLKAGKRQFEEHLPGWGAEIAWASDSNAFFVTDTEGGGGIGIVAYVFYLDSNRLRKIQVSRSVFKQHGFSKNCGGEFAPNVAAVGWLQESRTLLLVAEDVPVGGLCRCPGAFNGYEVKLPENVVTAVFSQAEMKHRFWGLLGCGLRDADDKCSPIPPRGNANE
jgi:hypothetical protein